MRQNSNTNLCRRTVFSDGRALAWSKVSMAGSGNSLHRSGSTLLVVIALMGMLALLGLMFFTFAEQEQASAKNYLESAKHIADPELGPDVYFDWALRQTIRSQGL